MALTIRLDNEETEALERLKPLVGNSTASGAIKVMISKYESLLSGYERTVLKNHDLESKLTKFQQVTKTYVDAQHGLTDMIYGDEWNEELIRRAKAMDAGETKTYTLEEFKQKSTDYLNEITNK